MALTQLKTSGIADDAVTTDKLANAINTERTANTAKVSLDADSVTGAKIADDAIDSEHITDGSIDNAHLADDAVGVAELSATGTASSSTFLRGDNSWAAVTSTTINTNADNRVLTGTGTANTIQGETQLLFDSSGLLYIKAPDGGNRYFFGETGDSQSAQLSLYNSSDQQKVRIAAGDGASAADTFFTGGNVGIGTNSPTAASSETTLNIYANEYPELHLTSSVTGTAAGDGTIISLNNDSSTIIRNQENSYIRFDTNGSNERMRILAAGGLTFNGDTAADNALDDYEEGLYNPTLSGSSSTTDLSMYSNDDTLSYIKVGSQCWVYGRIRLNNVNFSGGLRMTLPFAAASGSEASNAGQSAVATHGVEFSPYSSTQCGLWVETYPGTSYGVFVINRDDDSWTTASSSNIKQNAYLAIQHLYKTT